MRASHRWTSGLSALLVALALSAPLAVAQTADPVIGDPAIGPADVANETLVHPATQAFLRACQQGEQYAPELGAVAAQIAGGVAEDPYAADTAITEALREIYPEYGKALFAFASEDLAQATDLLTTFAESNDPFLAADSQFFLGRLWMLEEQYEQALPVWQRLSAEEAAHTPYSGQALFFRGIAESGLLQRPQAAATLEQFLDENPTAPERLRISAVRQLDLLNRIEEGSLADVQYQMEFARRRLTLRDPGSETQETQTRIVDMLTQLIEEAEQQEAQNRGQGQQCKQCQGKGCQQCQGKPGSQGSAPGSGSDARTPDGRPGNEPRQQAWDHLRDKQREAKAFAAIKARFPQRYEELVKQYYETLQADPAGNE